MQLIRLWQNLKINTLNGKSYENKNNALFYVRVLNYKINEKIRFMYFFCRLKYNILNLEFNYLIKINLKTFRYFGKNKNLFQIVFRENYAYK